MLDQNTDTTVDEVLDEGQKPTETTETATPVEQNEITKADPQVESLQKELSRLRAAQSAADKRADEAGRRAKELEDQSKRATYGDDEVAYYKQIATDNARKAAELELKVEVNSLLEEHKALPEIVRSAIRKNPLGFIGDATDVPTAVYKIGTYLSELESKSEIQELNKPTAKEFKVVEAGSRVNTPSSKPKTLDDAVGKLIDAGLFN